MSAQVSLSPVAMKMLTVALLGSAFSAASEVYGTLTAMPVAAKELGQVELYAWTFTAFILAQVMAIVLAGKLTDRRGPAIALIGGSLVFALGLVGAGFAPSMWWLLVWRFVQGFGAGGSSLSLMVVVSIAYAGARRAQMMSAFAFAWVLPSFVGPPVSAWVTLHFGWHWVFWGVVPIMGLFIVIGAFPILGLHRQFVPAEQPPRGVPGWAAVLTALAVGGLQIAGQRLEAIPGLWGAVIGLAGLVGLVFGLPRLMPPGFVRLARGLPSVMAVRAMMAGGFFAAESFLTLLLTEEYAFSLDAAGIFLALGATGWTLGSVVQASPRLRIRRDQIIWWGAAIGTLGQGMIVPAVWFGWSWLVVAAGYLVASLGLGMAFPSTSLAIMQLSEDRYIGRNTSSLQVAEGIGNSLVTAGVGTVFASLHGMTRAATTYTPVYALCAAALGVGLWVCGRVGQVRNESLAAG